MITNPINIAVIGLGHWGPNLARNFNALPNAYLHTLCDADPARLQRVGANYPAARQTTDYESVLADPDVDAVVLATPVHTHFKLASAALRAGKHTFVEKPLARSSDEARELVAMADARGLILMVGHVFLYNAAVRKVKEYIDSGELGEIYYIYAQRLNLGIVRQDVNALWNFAPHDISIINYWLGGAPARVDAHGYAFLQPGIEDVVFMNLEYAGGQAAGVHVSWLDPNKVRPMTRAWTVSRATGWAATPPSASFSCCCGRVICSSPRFNLPSRYGPSAKPFLTPSAQGNLPWPTDATAWPWSRCWKLRIGR